ncbi:hypothetical protein [Sulfuritortus calidifontis]|nr:hypothetical protein [Sulfuritortus calidifontis]
MRADGLVRAILLISGGALTLSIGAFLRPEHPVLFPACLNLLHLSWILLVASMILAVAVVFGGVLASDLHSRHWLSWLRGGRKNELKQPRKANYILWTFGVLAILSHWTGLGLLAYLATKVVTT